MHIVMAATINYDECWRLNKVSTIKELKNKLIGFVMSISKQRLIDLLKMALLLVAFRRVGFLQLG